MSKLDKLLKSVPYQGSKSVLAGKPELCELLKEYLELKRKGDPRAHASLSWFYRNKLQDEYGGPTYGSVCRYVRDVMRLSTTTGEKLGT